MRETFQARVETCRSGTNPALICPLASGWVVLCDMQFLRGYVILLADPVVADLNALNQPQRARFLCDMALVGDALLEVTGAYRINYAIMGNSDPFLHAHIVPRYLDEPKDQRKGLPWSYPKDVIDSQQFDAERDQELIQQIARTIQARL